ncbi:Maf family protein [Caldibacillus lycopersici]|uniref:dTTP/UTP pyrophosphatase n=1 Tax=Perspicuibacillus lycopersici TaxID=1325689 RepID=A0AAE3ISX8_9BACI|nr:Maf family protein [Perspicuibacillus lycopersici]
MARLILASSSPRRREILKQVQHNFEIIISDVDETIEEILPPEQVVMTLASKKAHAVAKHYPDAYVIGADTVVYLAPQILGKPANKVAAKQMLVNLSGKTHTVYTGISVIHGSQEETSFVKTDVTFWELSEKEIEHYIQTGEPFDKAGSYGIQGYGATLVKSINGDYFSVVGLPIAKLYRTLQTMGYAFF